MPHLSVRRFCSDNRSQLCPLLSFGQATFDTIPADHKEGAKPLKPILTHLANAAGLHSSPYFDANGNYVGKL